MNKNTLVALTVCMLVSSVFARRIVKRQERTGDGRGVRRHIDNRLHRRADWTQGGGMHHGRGLTNGRLKKNADKEQGGKTHDHGLVDDRLKRNADTEQSVNKY